MLGMGINELVVVLIVVVLLFGGKKIPELMRGVGKGLGEFKAGVEDAKYTARRALEEISEEKPVTVRKAPDTLPRAAAEEEVEPKASA